MRALPAFTLAIALCAAATMARAAEPQTDEQKALYALGVAMSQNLSSFSLSDAELEFVKAGLADGAKGKTPAQADVAKFESDALKAAGIDFAPVPPRYRSTYFSHVFASPIGYSSGYYAYIWSEVLARDTEHWFDTHGGLKRENGDLLRQKVLSRGFSVDALTMFRDFYGKGPEIGPLLEARGLTSGTGTSGR